MHTNIPLLYRVLKYSVFNACKDHIPFSLRGLHKLSFHDGIQKIPFIHVHGNIPDLDIKMHINSLCLIMIFYPQYICFIYAVHSCLVKSPLSVPQLLLTHGASTCPLCGASWPSSGPSSWPSTHTDTARSLQTSASSVTSSQHGFL